MKTRRFFSSKNIAVISILFALVIILQSVALITGLFFVTSLSFVLIPITLGAIMLGPAAGGLLGLLFGILVLIFGATGVDAFTAQLLGLSPLLTVLTCLLKGVAAGVVPGLLYRAIKGKNRYVAAVVAALAAPVMNTGIFVLGAMCMWGVFESFAQQSGVSVMYFIIVTCALVNFLIEFVSTVVAAPAIYRVTEAIRGSSAVAEREKTAESLSQEERASRIEKG